MSPMIEREMIIMIVDTLPVLYYEKMVGYMPSIFADLVFAGERIEVGLKIGKFDYTASMNSGDMRPGRSPSDSSDLRGRKWWNISGSREGEKGICNHCVSWKEL